MKKTHKKLTILPETIRNLTKNELPIVVGGGTFTSNPVSWCYSCKVTCTG